MSGTLAERHLFCFGLGFSAGFLAPLVQAAGGRVSGTVRSPERVESWRARGVEARVFDGGAGLPEEAFAGVTDLLVSIPPQEGGAACPALAAHRGALARLPLRWIGYFSSTAVYGDCGGEWIDETRPPAPRTADARARLAAEEEWKCFARETSAALDILRIAGIYGPGGRSALGQMRSGRARAIVKPGQVFNRIHAEDIAGAALAAMTHPAGERLTNLADDLPAPAAEVLDHAAGLLGLPVPERIAFDDAALPPGAASFYAENRRLSNARLKALPGFALRYPTYREGLAAILSGEKAG